mmetsp:Transcript_34106/g.70442  ORF Transcript_34106/g.70442 Transcript_34106/m.70442 type:complete len:406 (-) Transcript_34106:234-1451(-)|eukprot:CAMPEP_0181333392 /NCGR_PEP_ID=MMETSP1101-20121128/25648_1 /TAXON_ID=46948 /ORGANISM="Rhodomonas abbreviata, Strain Caron Lab Isolate" /LENGTH=405 /DNA_ID=CAMNT_0023443191 /DNA_START=217 /DNA_END=1434 /DNA_ORIENTATION=-
MARLCCLLLLLAFVATTYSAEKTTTTTTTAAANTTTTTTPAPTTTTATPAPTSTSPPTTPPPIEYCPGVEECLETNSVEMPTTCSEVDQRKAAACQCFRENDCTDDWDDTVVEWKAEDPALSDCDFGSCEESEIIEIGFTIGGAGASLSDTDAVLEAVMDAMAEELNVDPDMVTWDSRAVSRRRLLNIAATAEVEVLASQAASVRAAAGASDFADNIAAIANSNLPSDSQITICCVSLDGVPVGLDEDGPASVNMVLRMPYTWPQFHTPSVYDSFIRAMAKAAGTTIDKVTINSVKAFEGVYDDDKKEKKDVKSDKYGEEVDVDVSVAFESALKAQELLDMGYFSMESLNYALWSQMLEPISSIQSEPTLSLLEITSAARRVGCVASVTAWALLAAIALPLQRVL